MRYQYRFIAEQARLVSIYNTETKEELEAILRENGGGIFSIYEDIQFSPETLEDIKAASGGDITTYENVMCSMNEHGILEGIGFTHDGALKIWDNTKLGTFKNKYEY